MRRGYLKGLVIGGIVGLAIGKMLKYKGDLVAQWEDDSRSQKDRFHQDKEFPINYSDDKMSGLDSTFDEKKYEKHFSQFAGDDEVIDDEVVQGVTEQDMDSEGKRVSKRKKPTRVSLNRRKRMGSLDE